MIKVENEKVEVKGIAIDIAIEFEALCRFLIKELGKQDFGIIVDIMAEKYLQKRLGDKNE